MSVTNDLINAMIQIEPDITTVLTAANPNWQTELAAEQSQDDSQTIETVYEYKELWAEESGAVSSNNSQYSWGNGDVGTIGAPIDNDWEIIGVWIDADSGGSVGESLSTGIMDFQNNSNTVITTVDITAAGDGQDNNAFLYVDLTAAPVDVPNGAKVGFRTITEVGTWAGTRAGVRMRRSIGNFIRVN